MRFGGYEGSWNKVALCEVANIIGGGTPDTSNPLYWNGDIDWFTPTEVGESKYVNESKRKITYAGLKNSSAKLLPRGTILLSTRASVGLASITTNPQGVTTNQGFQSVVPKRVENSEFLYYVISSQNTQRELKTKANGSTFPEISNSEVSSIIVSLPPDPKERFEISRFLATIDQRIRLQNKIIEGFQRQKKILRDAVFSNVRGIERPISEIVAYEQPSRYIVSSDDYSADASLTPVLTANKGFILGYTADKEGIYHRGDAVILDDFTLDMKYVDFPFKVKSSAIKILTCNDKSTLRYIYEYLCYLNLNSSEHKRHYISEIAPMKIVLPTAKTIETIACLFEKMDQRVVREQRIQELLVSQKQYLLSAMFI